MDWGWPHATGTCRYIIVEEPELDPQEDEIPEYMNLTDVVFEAEEETPD